MRQHTIISGTGQVRGRVDEGDNTILWIYNRQGHPLGSYNQVQDKTYSVTGRYVGPGDQRMTLIEE
jgi:hypothetical protein